MVQSDANQSPWPNSLITRENTENFADWYDSTSHDRREKHIFDGHLTSDSLIKLNRELISSNRESTRVIRERIV